MVTVTAYALSGALAAAGGLILGGYIAVGSLDAGEAIVLNSIAVVLIGGTSFAGGQGGVVGTFIGVAILAILTALLIQLGVPIALRSVILAVIVITGAVLQEATGEQLSGTVGCRTEATPALSREWPRRPEEGRMTRRSPGGLKAFVAPLLAAATVAALALPAVAQDNLDPAQFNTGKQPPYTIGVSNDSVANPFRVQMLNEIEYFAKAHPELIKELVVLNAGEDANKQLSDVQDLISRGVDGIVLSPNSSTAFDSVLDEATAATIPVATYNMTVEDGSKVIAQIAPPFQAWQKRDDPWLADQMGGKGNVIVLRGIAGTPVDALEWAGAKEVLDANPDMKVICEEYANWDYGAGKTATELHRQLPAGRRHPVLR